MTYDGKKIAALRLAKGWKAAELARRAKISQPSLWAIENEVTKKLKADTLISLANALGVPMKALLRAPKGKNGADSADQLIALYESLDAGNRQVLLAAAEALLKNQPRP